LNTLGRQTAFRAFLALTVAAVVVPRPCRAAVAEPPHRIVSTSPSITETLFALGVGERVVGVSRYCRYPPAVLALPKVGTFLKPDVELIARLSPDLVLIHASADGLEGRLSAVRLRSVSIDRDAGLAGVYASIGAIGEAAGVPERAHALLAEIQARLGHMRDAARTSAHPKVLLIVGRRPGTLADIVAVGRRGYLGELLEFAGGSNVLEDPNLPEYPRISLETVIRLRPDLIIDTGDMGDTAEERDRNGRVNGALWRSNPLVRAAGVKRIHAATTDALVVPGPRVIEAAEWLRSLVQEDRVP
jgi:iron complex transport system substrate-binding protein